MQKILPLNNKIKIKRSRKHRFQETILKILTSLHLQNSFKYNQTYIRLRVSSSFIHQTTTEKTTQNDLPNTLRSSLIQAEQHHKSTRTYHFYLLVNFSSSHWHLLLHCTVQNTMKHIQYIIIINKNDFFFQLCISTTTFRCFSK